MAQHMLPGTEAEDISDSVAQLALQGPKAQADPAEAAARRPVPQGLLHRPAQRRDRGGINCHDLPHRLHRRGLGYEIYCASEDGPKLWEVLLEAGEGRWASSPAAWAPATPCAWRPAMPLYGHEMDDGRHPSGSRPGLRREDGQAGLHRQGCPGCQAGSPLPRAGGPAGHRPRHRPRAPGRVRRRPRRSAMTTSGTHCPFLGKAVAMAYAGRQARRSRHQAGGRGPRPPRGRGDHPAALLHQDRQNERTVNRSHIQ